MLVLIWSLQYIEGEKITTAIPFMNSTSLKFKSKLKKLNFNASITPNTSIFQFIRSVKENINYIETAEISNINYTYGDRKRESYKYNLKNINEL